MAKRKKKRRAWTSSELRELKAMARKKTKASQIAKKLKRTERAVAHAVYEQVDQIAAEEGVSLTDPAREMLALPVVEQYPNDAEMNREIVGSSIRLIISAAKNPPPEAHPGETMTMGALNARAIILGFWAKYCNIPPFCGRRG